jgi:Pol polyprotein/gag-pre-integrase-like protein
MGIDPVPAPRRNDETAMGDNKQKEGREAQESGTTSGNVECFEGNDPSFTPSHSSLNNENFVLTCIKNGETVCLNNSKWVLDCGATDTMTYDRNDFISIGTTHKKFIQTASGECITVEGAETINILPGVQLKNCLFVPQLSHKLLSMSQLTEQLNCTVLMESRCCVIQDLKTGITIGRGTEEGGLYYVEKVSQKGCATLARDSVEQQLWRWHRRLGHPSLEYLEHLFPSLRRSKLRFNCESCILAKSHKHSYYPSLSQSSQPFVLIHSDVWGPAPDGGTSVFSYYVLFIDDCTRMSWVYFIKHKSEVYDVCEIP